MKSPHSFAHQHVSSVRAGLGFGGGGGLGNPPTVGTPLFIIHVERLVNEEGKRISCLRRLFSLDNPLFLAQGSFPLRNQRSPPMNDAGQYRPCELGCNAPVPAELESERLCVLHFILSVEQACAEMRRETAAGRASAERQTEILNHVVGCGATLARVATGSLRLTDELKKRILSTFLTLMNLRENLDRSASRGVPELRVAS